MVMNVGWQARDWGEMSQVFEGYELQYCDLSANLTRKCTSASVLDGGISLLIPSLIGQNLCFMF